MTGSRAVATESSFAGLRLAVGTLTVIPIGDVGDIKPWVARSAMLWAPVAVLPLAALSVGISFGGAYLGLPPLLLAALVLGALAWGSRGMHLDGFADTVDGFAAGWDRERALTVMRKGDVGPLGAAGLLLLLLIEAAAAAAVLDRHGGWLLLGWAVISSRWGVTLVCRRGVPPARDSGLGAVVAGTVPTGSTVLGGVLLAVLGAVTAWGVAAPFWQPPLGVLGGTLVVVGLTHKAVRLLGGVTGDIMGACIEASFAVLLVTLAVSL